MYTGIGLIFSVIYRIALKRENAKRERGERDEIIGDEKGDEQSEINGRFATIEDSKREKGDEWSGFRYML